MAETDNKSLFLEYLRQEKSRGKIRSYELYFENKLDELEQEILGITKEHIFEIDDIVNLEKLLKILSKNKGWDDYSYKQHGHGIPNAIVSKHYRKFLELKNQKFIEDIENNAVKINGETERKAVVKVRLGQSELRNKILKKRKECEICKIKNEKLLIISHIKPWAKSNDLEKLSEDNILLLCPMHDALFDKGLISFNENGEILISSELDDNELKLMNIDKGSNIKINSEEQTKFLKYHRKNIFLK